MAFATFAQADTTKRDEDVIVFIDVLAEFPGGRKELLKFLSENIKVPDVVIKDSLDGRSVLQCVIEIDGSVSNIILVRKMKGCPECDAEAVRVVRMMPKWIPAEKYGKPVSSPYTIPIDFSYK